MEPVDRSNKGEHPLETPDGPRSTDDMRQGSGRMMNFRALGLGLAAVVAIYVLGLIVVWSMGERELAVEANDPPAATAPDNR